jgi:hypothetical protein
MRLSKRDLVKGAAALALSLAGRSAGRGVSFDATAAAAVVVYNDWYPQARAFAAAFPPGTHALAVEGDAGKLWYERLRGLLATEGVRRIAGMTTHTDLLILETLARSKGLRVRRRSPEGRLVSWVLI